MPQTNNTAMELTSLVGAFMLFILGVRCGPNSSVAKSVPKMVVAGEGDWTHPCEAQGLSIPLDGLLQSISWTNRFTHNSCGLAASLRTYLFFRLLPDRFQR
jgi:hypothetical protein